MKHPCSYAGCSEEFNSIEKHALHMALTHESFPSGQPIQEATLKSLAKIKDRVHYLLLRFPETRNPHNWMLWVRYAQAYATNHPLVYDVEHKGWMINRPNGVLEAQDWKAILLPIESVRRLRQKLQAEDRAKYHQAQTVLEHRCILPDEQATAEAAYKEETMRRWGVS
jgi:hypothetical protein